MISADDVRAIFREEIKHTSNTVDQIKTAVTKINGRVKKCELAIAVVEEDHRHKSDKCPHTEVIKIMRDNMMNEQTLKDYMEKVASTKVEEDRRRQKRTENLLLGGMFILALITILMNIV